MRNGEFSKEKLLFFSSQLAYSEAVAQTCSVKKVFLEISQNLQEHTCARVVAHRTPLVFWWFSMKTISEWFSQNTSGGCFCLLSEAVSLRCSVKTMFSKISQNSQKSNSLFFNKVAVFRPATLSRTGLWRRCFPVNSAKFLRTLFYRTPTVAVFVLPSHKDVSQQSIGTQNKQDPQDPQDLSTGVVTLKQLPHIKKCSDKQHIIRRMFKKRMQLEN